MINIRFIRATDKYLGVFLCYLLYFFAWVVRPVFRQREKKEIDKILMIKFWGIGNLVMILPTIKAVRSHYPNAQIDMFTLWTNRQVVQHNPCIDNAYFLYAPHFLMFVVSYLRNVFRMRRERYDMILDFEQFAKVSSLFGLLIGGRERIGFDTPGQGRGIAYTRRVAYIDYKHMVETFFRIAKGAGVRDAELSPVRLDVSEQEREKVGSFLKSNGVGEEDMIVGVHIGSGENMMSQRTWGKEKFARLADILIDEYGAKIVLTGAGKTEAKLVAEVLSLMNNEAVNAVNKLSIKEVAGLTERCRFFISNDTALVHIASSMGTRVVGIFGPNTPYLYGPRGSDDLLFYKDLYCSPCITNYNAKISSCNDPVCIESITLEEVVEGIRGKYL